MAVMVPAAQGQHRAARRRGTGRLRAGWLDGLVLHGRPTCGPAVTASLRCSPNGPATACATPTRSRSSTPSSPPASRCSACAAACSCST
jgi:hypothetical protein